tara:strand:+ start:3356 stop:4873 length:1518 start_codon:yes stop_codon:yes gene_type:complete
MTLKDEIINCIESNNMNKLVLLIDNSDNSFDCNFSDEEIFKIFTNLCNKDITLSFSILYNKLKDKSYIHKNNELLFRTACKNGAINIVKWIYENTPVDIYVNDIECFFSACYSNNTELILWLKSKINKKIDYHKEDDKLIRTCAEKNLVDVVILLNTFSNFSMSIDKKYNDMYKHEDLFHFFCRHGYMDCAKEFLKVNDYDINCKDNEAICLSCQEGHLEMVKWLYNLGGDIKSQDDWCFNISISKNHLELLKWINSLQVVDIHKNNEYFFRTSCSFGKLEIAKWIYSLGNVDIHAYMDSAFLSACIGNHLEIAKWLYTLGTFNLHFDNNLFFKYLCQQGKLNILQWLYSIDQFNVNEYNDYYFRISCNFNYLEQAKWIYNLGNVNIKANKNEAFIFSCSNNKVEMALWLQSINEVEYEIEVNNSMITSWKIHKIIKFIGKKSVESQECPICFNDNSNLITSCNHQFCQECFKSYAESQDHSIDDLPCPYCRQTNLKFYEIDKDV